MMKEQARDEETALMKDTPASPQNEPPKDAATSAKQDVTDAAFWLFMLFLASVTMTVGNKVRRDLCS